VVQVTWLRPGALRSVVGVARQVVWYRFAGHAGAGRGHPDGRNARWPLRVRHLPVVKPCGMHRDAAGGGSADDRCMDSTGRVVLRLEVITSSGQPVSGLVWDGDGSAHAFCGWSEMFAVLQVLTSPRGSGAVAEEGP